MKTIKEQADSIVEKFKPHVNPYIGSGMLSNTHDDDAISWQATHCAIIYCEGIIEALEENLVEDYDYHQRDKFLTILTELKSRI